MTPSGDESSPSLASHDSQSHDMSASPPPDRAPRDASARNPRPRDPKSIVTPDAFSVSPVLLGTPLAAPWRRLTALFLDLMLVGLLEALSWRLLLGGAVLMLFLVLARRPDAGRLRRTAVGCGGALLVAATVFVTFVPALWRAGVLGPERASTPDSVAADAMRDGVAAGEPQEVGIREMARFVDSLAQAAASDTANLGETEPEQPSTAFAWIRDIADEAGLIFGWGTVYLTLFTAFWNGRTPGKRLLRLRVARLDGEPLGLLLAFERAGGYAAGFATGLVGFARVWWDPNRQAIHDKIAETVVVKENRPAYDRTRPSAKPEQPQ